MGRPYSQDLRERVVAAVEEGRLSRRKAATQFALGISTAINWVAGRGKQAVFCPARSAGTGLRQLRASTAPGCF
jgi:putative transposase